MESRIENCAVIMIEHFHLVQARMSDIPISSTGLESIIKNAEAFNVFMRKMDGPSSRRPVIQKAKEEIFKLEDRFDSSAKIRSSSKAIHIFPCNFCFWISYTEKKKAAIFKCPA